MLLHQPSISINANDKGTSASLPHCQQATETPSTAFHKIILHHQQSTNSTYSLEGIRNRSKAGQEGEHLMSTATVWLLW
jgi:hypothetical protein